VFSSSSFGHFYYPYCFFGVVTSIIEFQFYIVFVKYFASFSRDIVTYIMSAVEGEVAQLAEKDAEHVAEKDATKLAKKGTEGAGKEGGGGGGC
jgi:hypothetical protein